MRHLRHFERFGAALVAVLMVMAGAPASACAEMSDCTVTVPAPVGHCHHGSPAGNDSLVPSSPAAADDCCALLAARPPMPAPSPETPPAAPLGALDATAGDDHLAAPEPPRPPTRGGPPLPRPAGRTLLSLQQTLLI